LAPKKAQWEKIRQGTAGTPKPREKQLGKRVQKMHAAWGWMGSPETREPTRKAGILEEKTGNGIKTSNYKERQGQKKK